MFNVSGKHQNATCNMQCESAISTCNMLVQSVMSICNVKIQHQHQHAIPTCNMQHLKWNLNM